MSRKPVVTKEEFIEWKKHPVTQRLLVKIDEDVSIMKELLIHTSFSELKETQGRIKACLRLLQVEYEDLYE